MDYGAEDVKTRTTAEELATLVRAVAVSPCPVDVHLTPRMSTLVPGGVFIGGVVPRPCRDGFVLVPPPPGAAADILRPRKQPNAFAGNVFRGAGLGVVAAARDGVFSLQCWHGAWSVWRLIRCRCAQAPEYTFTCQTAVLAASFHTFDPYLVLGGTYSGQVRWGVLFSRANVYG